ncbi:MAG TPA: ABC transporter permease [Tepidisphaeraceae bacterium]|jgi:peptide/nickel transport system permease protein|nr:ABC transporter permease [Tepidisphaeraceae bacterium]
MTIAAQDKFIPPPDPAQAVETPARPRHEGWRRVTHRPVPLICLIVTGIYVLLGLTSLTPLLNAKIENPVGDSYQAPTLKHLDLWLGADIQGRSVFWRVLYGTRVALLITVSASAISLTVGTFLGVVSGYFGGWIDDIITWLFTTVSSVPWILLVLAMAYTLKQTTIWGHPIPPLGIIIIALGLTDWVGLCRLIRGDVLKHRDRDYVLAARAAGLGDWRILFRHILPNVSHLIIITFSLAAVSYVQAEVALTFLGLGISDSPSWGRMIDDANVELLRGVWWQLAAATVAITILCLALNILGDALRDALDPRLRGLE